MRLIFFAIYLGIGAMLHALFVGPHFDWQSAWTFGWLFGWPIMVVGALWSFGLVIAVVVGICILVWSWIELIAKWRAARRT